MTSMKENRLRRKVGGIRASGTSLLGDWTWLCDLNKQAESACVFWRVRAKDVHSRYQYALAAIRVVVGARLFLRESANSRWRRTRAVVALDKFVINGTSRKNSPALSLFSFTPPWPHRHLVVSSFREVVLFSAYNTSAPYRMHLSHFVPAARQV